MIDNQYIYELDIDLDYSYINKLVKSQQFSSVPGMAASHHRRVIDDPYMTFVQEQYPCLSPTYNIYTMKPGEGLPLHIDARRTCAFNIPIFGTENSYTIFYESEQELTYEFNPIWIINDVTSPVKEVFRHTLIRPVLINTSIPHCVEVNGNNDRIILSWSADPKYNFEDIKKIFIN